MTNAGKGTVLGIVTGVILSGMELVEAFGVYDFTDRQATAIVGFVGAVALAGGALIHATRRRSPAWTEPPAK